MGEAKWRKQHDPQFGKPKRGLVLSNPVEIDGGSLHVKSSNLDPQELRQALLFWDELVWPSSRMVHFGSGPDEQFLQNLGILKRPEFSFSGVPAYGTAATQIHAFETLNEKEPNKWTLAQGESSFLFKGGYLVPDEGMMLGLHQAIPVPDVDVPLNEILEFKAKRVDELYELRGQIDTFFASLNESSDKQKDLADHVKRIDEACANAIRVSREWQFPIRLMSIKTTFEFRPLVTGGGALAAFAAASQRGLTLTHSILAGIGGAAAATAPALKIASDFGWRGLRSRTSPYRYVSDYHNEVFR